MRIEEQGIEQDRYVVTPRTLTFLTFGQDVLLLRGATGRLRFPGKLNGVGGHLESGEEPLEAALREVREETGLVLDGLTLRVIVHITGKALAAGVMLFVFVGAAPSREVRAAPEGDLDWYPLQALPADVVEDLPVLLQHVIPQSGNRLVYGLYTIGANGELSWSFRPG
ncbi:MAG: NUDIX domain-containing protein [Anaerolineae bacterium]